MSLFQILEGLLDGHTPSWAKTIKKNTNSTQNKCQTPRANQYEVTSFLSTDCELSTETCSKNATLAENGDLVAEMTHRIQSGWKNWKRISGILCDRRTSLRVKGKSRLKW